VTVARALDTLAAEVIVERLAALELLAVDQQRVRSGQGIPVLVEIAEERGPGRDARDADAALTGRP
jgi:hypothetical protein